MAANRSETGVSLPWQGKRWFDERDDRSECSDSLFHSHPFYTKEEEKKSYQKPSNTAVLCIHTYVITYLARFCWLHRQNNLFALSFRAVSHLALDRL